jgi:hypothetical protein
MRRVLACDYDAVYMRTPVSPAEPAVDLEFWLSAGSRHVWNPAQRTPGTDWERRIDTLVLEETASTDIERRRQQFIAIQGALAEQVPILYFAAPRLYVAHAARLRGIVPSVQLPYVLWNGDLLHVAQ